MQFWCAYTRGASDLGSQIEGGATRGRKFGLAGNSFFSWANMVATARIDWIEVGRLSLRIVGVSEGTRRGKIIDSAGCLAVGSVGWQYSATKRPASFTSAGLVFTGASTGVSRQSKLMDLNHNQ